MHDLLVGNKLEYVFVDNIKPDSNIIDSTPIVNNIENLRYMNAY